MTAEHKPDGAEVVQCAACGDEHHSALLKVSPYPHYSEPKLASPDIMKASGSTGPLIPYGPENPNPQGYDPSKDDFSPANGGGD